MQCDGSQHCCNAALLFTKSITYCLCFWVIIVVAQEPSASSRHGFIGDHAEMPPDQLGLQIDRTGRGGQPCSLIGQLYHISLHAFCINMHIIILTELESESIERVCE